MLISMRSTVLEAEQEPTWRPQGRQRLLRLRLSVLGCTCITVQSPIPSIPAHIANGMYGMILVEPEGGLPKVDHEYAVIQSEFFTAPSHTKGLYVLSMEKGLAEQPDHVVFNGKAGALTGDGELKAKVGDTVRLYFGNIGPNSISSFHIIGEIFDKVYVEGAIGGLMNQNVQTTLVPSAGAVIVEFKN